MRLIRFLEAGVALAVVGLLLGGCASTTGGPGTDSPFGDITKLTVTDLQAALARATRADDKPAMMCYPVLIGIVQGLPSQTPDTQLAGIVDAFEAARVLSKKAAGFSGSTDPMIQAVNLGCAALYNDAKGDVLRLMIKLRP